MTTSFLLCSLLGLLSIAWLIRRLQTARRQRGHVLPPGPKRLPIIGNLLDLSAGTRWSKFDDFAVAFGDIVYLEAVGSPMIVVSSPEIAFDLLEKRSAIYSDRPFSTFDELMGFTWNLGRMPYGQQWRNNRRCFYQYFNQAATLKHRDVQTAEARKMLSRVSEAGGHLSSSQLRHMLASVIVDIVYGMPNEGFNNAYVQTTEKAIKAVIECRPPGVLWINFFPFLRYVPAWVPGAKAKRLAERCRPILEQARNYGFDYTRSNKESKDCMALDLITRLQNDSASGTWLDEDVAKDTTAAAYISAVDTTLGFLSFFFAAMAMHPEVQRKAQAELDRVVGPSRLPSFEDLDSLPYLGAIILECTRWAPVAPFGLPHRVIRDDYYKQYFIPEGSVVFPNVKRMLYDPEEYPEPEHFNPERFLKEGKLNPDVRDPTTLHFGFGRRVCLGRHFAKDSGFIVMVTTLYAYDVHPSVDENGNALDVTPTGGVVASPTRLACYLTPRSEASAQLLNSVDELADWSKASNRNGRD